MPLDDFYRLLDDAARQIDGFGARIVSARTIEASGRFGQILRCGVTLHDTLHRFVAETPNMGNVHAHHLFSDPDRRGVWLARSGSLELEGGVVQSELMVLNFVVELVRLAAGPQWKPLALRLRSRNLPLSSLEGSSVFEGVPVSLGCDWGGICIPKHLMAHPMPAFQGAKPGDPPASSIDEVSTRMEPTIRALLLSCSELHMELSLSSIGEILRFHPRSLQRALAAEGTNFRNILDQVRCLKARRLILETDASLAEVAFAVGYSDQANFTRAYRRWTGSTPGALRLEAA